MIQREWKCTAPNWIEWQTDVKLAKKHSIDVTLKWPNHKLRHFQFSFVNRFVRCATLILPKTIQFFSLSFYLPFSLPRKSIRMVSGTNLTKNSSVQKICISLLPYRINLPLVCVCACV